MRGALLPRLEQAGRRVSINFRDLRPGASSITERGRALLTAQRTLFLLTPAHLASEQDGLLDYPTCTGFKPQMSFAYSRIVRSDEK